MWLTALILYKLQQGMQVFLQKQHNFTCACLSFLVKSNLKLRNICMKDSSKYPHIWESVVLISPSLHALHFLSLNKQWSLCLRSHSNTFFLWSDGTSPTTPQNRERKENENVSCSYFSPLIATTHQTVGGVSSFFLPCFGLFCLFVL